MVIVALLAALLAFVIMPLSREIERRSRLSRATEVL
jgi:hypothetical protein